MVGRVWGGLSRERAALWAVLTGSCCAATESTQTPANAACLPPGCAAEKSRKVRAGQIDEYAHMGRDDAIYYLPPVLRRYQ